MFVKNCCTMYDGFTGINFEATLRKNKISTAPINVNRNIFSINILPIGIHFLQLKDKKAHVSINVNRRTTIRIIFAFLSQSL